MKKIFRGKKKFIFALVALILIFGILIAEFNTNVVEVEAKQNIFEPVTNYTANGLNVLEITPDASMGEMGYFIPNAGNNNQGYRKLSDASQGTRYGVDDDDNTPNHVRILLEMRKYGMIKYLGLDSVTEAGVSEFPIYTARWATFAYKVDQGGYLDLPGGSTELVYGHYELDDSLSGAYNIKDGYVLGDGTEKDDLYDQSGMLIPKLEANYFYKEVPVTITEDIVSDNGMTYPEEREVTGYEKLSGGMGLPAAVEYVITGGNLKFVYIVNQADIYQGYSSTLYKYLGNREPDNGWFKNGNWFREYILGDAAVNVPITYSIVPAGSVSEDMIKNADLVYISGTSQQFITNGQDISPQVAQLLYNQTTQGYAANVNGTTVTKYKAIMMDYAAFSGGDVPANNIDMLAALTWQENQTAIPVNHTDRFDENGQMTNTVTTADTSLYAELKPGMQVGYNGNFATNNIYVYNHHWQDYQDSLLKNEQVDALDNFANGDLKSPYTSAAATQGFSSVLAYIKINNNKTSIGHVAEGVVTPALVIQYILSYQHEDLGAVKSQYSVLEIQPTREFLYNKYNESVAYGISEKQIQDNRDEFIKTFLSEDLTKGGRQEYVTFTSMTIDEFNTRQENILALYDIVYIGDEWSKYYSHSEGTSKDIENNQIINDAVIPSQYNDTSMTGMIYYNQGDKETTHNLRYSSRDLTEAKLNELKNYLDNDALIIVGKELMASATPGNTMINPTKVSSAVAASVIDNGRVDSSSNLYELLAYGRGSVFDASTGTYSAIVSGNAIGAKANLVSEWDVANEAGARLALSSYLGRSRLTLQFSKIPSAYTYTADDKGAAANATYLDKEKDGKYYLRYEFAITNSEIDAALGQTYNLHFYEDVNGDGRFGDTEEKTDIKIRDIASGDVATSTTVDGVTTYNLVAGVSYELVRQVPSDEGGVINWCVKVEKSTDANVCATEVGYVAIKPMNRKILNILQITDADAGVINLEALSKTGTMGTYLYAPVVLDQYDINIRTITTEQFEADFAAYLNSVASDGFSTVEAKYLNYFSCFQRNEEFYPVTITSRKEDPMNVNMLVLGFGNSMEDLDSITSNAVKSYVTSGKPVLTSNSFITQTANTDLASEFGVDRYGYYSALFSNMDKTVSYSKGEAGYAQYATRREGSENAIGYTIGNERASITSVPQGITNTIIRAQYRENGATPTYLNSETVNSYNKLYTKTYDDFMYVDMMNEGQICHFPYAIDEHVKIRKSSAQDFQLDLDTDGDNDNHSDAIVWFTLSAISDSSSSFDSARSRIGGGTGNIYIETPGDGINNYYIYNYGNVTYTGLGYYGNELTVGEAQLFVNTLLAAYEAGYSNPIVNYYQTADVNDGKLDSIAVAYDGNVTHGNDIDSSIQYDEATRQYLYKFVNPNTNPSVDKTDGTKAFFKVTDTNFVKGEKVADVAFYLGVSGVKGNKISIKDGSNTYTYEIEEITLEDNTVVTVVRIPIDIYNSEFTEKLGTSSIATSSNGTNPQLKVGVMYGFYAPMSYLERMGAAPIYIQANTGYKALDDNGKEVVKPLGTAFDLVTLIKQELLKLD